MVALGGVTFALIEAPERGATSVLVLGAAVVGAAALVAFVLSSAYYAVATPLEQRAVGAGALDRGRPTAAKVVAELVRTAARTGAGTA